jgi:hypothetical protein
MHVRAATYEWDWEQFNVNYMVFDGCYKMAVALQLIQPVPNHASRFSALFQWLDMPQDAKRIVDLTTYRNLLVHEALWNRRQPGTGWREGPIQARYLMRINDRLLLALAGYRGPYLSTPWWAMGVASI